ncbi:MAG: lipid-A-disaccharide synthase [Opitutales bacterium]|nr:lipid-A-disaccharide synthase [Opitutales bacterium]
MVKPSRTPLPPPAAGGVDVLVLAGEHSGDEHAAALVADLRNRQPGLRVAAIGGDRLAAAGAQLLHDLTATSVVGLVEVLRHYPYFRWLFRETLEWIAQHRPRVVVLVDYPGFNLRLAMALKARGLSRKGGGGVAVYGYISPQVWAWKAKRRFRLAECLDELGVIFPFEVDCYADTTLDTRFVGHPFMQGGYASPLIYDAKAPLLLLPGSRLQPISRIFPTLLEAARGAARAGHLESATVIYPSESARALLESLIYRVSPEGLPRIEFVRSGRETAGSAVLTSSGTMSLSCALAGLPGAIVYRAHPLTYWIGRRLVKVPFLGIANLILNRAVYREYIQDAATPAELVAEIADCQKNPLRRAAAASDADALRTALSAPPDENAPQRILALMEAR